MLEKGMQKTWKVFQNGTQMGAKIDQKRGPKIDAKKGSHARSLWEVRRVGRAAPSRVLNISKRLVFVSWPT